MKRILSIALLLASSIFADTIYLRDGKEVNDAVITEIGVSDVKYKVGSKEVVYIVKKSDIAIIFYSDGSKEVFEAESKNDNSSSAKNNNMQNIQNTVIIGGAKKTSNYQNFTGRERRTAWLLNALTLNGLGSWLVMGDVVGGFAHLGFGVATVSFLVNNNTTVGVSMLATGAVWNIYRSVSYDKPRKVAYSEYGNFNFAVLPNRNGNLNAYMMYSKEF